MVCYGISGVVNYVVSLTVVFSIVTQCSSKWKPIKTLHLTKESFQNKNTSAQSRLGEHGPLRSKNTLKQGNFLNF